MSYEMSHAIRTFLPYVVAVAFVAVWGTRLLAQYRRRAQNFYWFAGRHPDCVQHGRVACPSCGGSRINARGLMQRTYMREHFCVTCGHTLYYSREDGGKR